MRTKAYGFMVLLLSIVSVQAFTQPDPTQLDRTLSPYFVVLTDDPTIDQLPLQSTRADAEIAGVMANVKVTQVYKNNGQRALEAIYVFPLSTNAAVYAMRMTLGNRQIEAQIKEREEARQEYEEAKEEGKTATLLEQNRPNVFQMNVANILPGDVIQVELNYVELLVPEDGIYEFVYPAVVGPRYSTKKASEDGSGKETWIETPYQHEGEEALYDFDVAVQIHSGIPLQSVSSPSHAILVDYPEPAVANVVLSTKERAGLRDYTLRYNLRGSEIQSGILLHEGKDENFFLVMVEPPARVETSQIPQREYLFVLDISGSMAGFPLEVAKDFLKRLLSDLRPTDLFNVIAFAGGNAVLFPESRYATPENIQIMFENVDRLHGGGGTELWAALQRVYGIPLYSKELARSIVVITDGYIAAEYEVIDEIRSRLNQANVFAAGIGSSPNRFLIEGIAHTGQGEPLFVSNQKEVEERVEKYKNYIKEPLLTHIDVRFEGFDAYDVEPPAVPDLFAQRPIIVYGKYRGDALGSIAVTGQTTNGTYQKVFDLSTVFPQEANSALRYLWARKRIQLKSDYMDLSNGSYAYNPLPQATKDELKREIIELGLKYNLLTAFTSFIAVLSEIRNEGGDPEQVNQPLPLPEGVEDTALPGGSSVLVESWANYDETGLDLTAPSLDLSQEQRGTVIEIVDLCTVKVRIEHETILLRFEGVEPMAEEDYEQAIRWLQEWLIGREVVIQPLSIDTTNPDQTVWTGHLFLKKVNVAQELIKKGFVKSDQ